MTEEKLDRCLQSIGKRCFENCYAIAEKKREALTIDDLINHDPDLQGTTERGLITRLNCIKRIFREGNEEKVLEMAKNRRRS